MMDELFEQIDAIPGPVFTDGCEHGKNCYVGSVNVLHRWKKPGDSEPSFEERKYDVYIFEHPTLGQEICIREGNGAGEYISPGRLIDFIQTATRHSNEMPHYGKAFELLLSRGKFTWTRDT